VPTSGEGFGSLGTESLNPKKSETRPLRHEFSYPLEQKDEIRSGAEPLDAQRYLQKYRVRRDFRGVESVRQEEFGRPLPRIGPDQYHSAINLHILIYTHSCKERVTYVYTY
jgi:hypothetical protein